MIIQNDTVGQACRLSCITVTYPASVGSLQLPLPQECDGLETTQFLGCDAGECMLMESTARENTSDGFGYHEDKP